MTNKGTTMTNNWLALAEKLAEKRSLIKRLEIEKKELENEMIQLTAGQSHQEGKYAFILEIRKGNVKYADIPELQHIDLEKYRGPEVRSWRFKVLY